MIKLILLDVDGTLTDGGIYRGNDGIELKKFNVKDGYAIVYAQKIGINFGIITGRKSELVKIRAEELKMKYIYQGISEKTLVLKEIIKITSLKKEEIAYMGDDLNDLNIMKEVGLKGAPKDAAREIKETADFISSKKGGYGAVREFIEFIIKKENKWEEFLKNVK
ncbi:HAD-IIIA family hydrolase [Leptotrichia sp. OH3620_COT-345]|uniref:KdsC family phosphatase n=1 Tax=Leptotrichia sp. OH3620_COT-345 TaxID=2491048 RepID=UPI000F648B0D|nr:HAD-IIIA family hydrolase [Leptotrichia sp. OH3620_COT-345]RRD38472.1 HAD-IIIA family hydrolase [Leptotrichia sp. OH3620_COT-345]